MEGIGESILVDPDVRKIVPVLCDWGFLEEVYRYSLQHRFAEGYKGFIPVQPDSETGWWATRSKTELNGDNVALRRLTLESTDLPLIIGFVAIGLPIKWGRQRSDEKVIREDSRRNTVWVQPPDIARRLDTILDYERFAITMKPENPDPVRYEDPKPINLVEVERTTEQKISRKKGLLAIDQTARILKRSVGYQPNPQQIKKPHYRSGRSSRAVSPAR